MSVLKLTLISDPAGFKRGLNEATKSLKGFEKTGKQISSGLNKALGTIGAGLSIGMLTNFLKDASKAAIADNKSQALLAESLRNTIGASDGAIKSTEAWIKKTQLATSVADDDLRPALTTAVTATGSLTKGQRLLNLALDISAAKQLDLKSVTNALSKAQGGNLTSLKKLLPGVQLTGDYMAVLESHYKNMAKLSASNDPFQRMNIIFQDIQETIGQAILPSLQKFANYLASPQGQDALKQFVNGFKDIAMGAGKLLEFITQNINGIMTLVRVAIELKVAIWLNVTAMKMMNWWTNRTKASMIALGNSIKRTGIGLLVVGVAELGVGFKEAQDKGESFATWARHGLEGVGTNIVDFSQWIFGQETRSEKIKKIADADQNRWIAMGKYFGKTVAKHVKKGISQAQDAINKVGESFRDSVGLAFGVTGKDEYSFFNMDRVIDKLKRMVDAAKGFKDNIEKLKKAGAGRDVIAELIGMGPAQGNIVAQGLLQSGRLSEYLALRGSLYGTGTQVGGQLNTASNNTYNINLNKANVSASDIIRAIQAYEKKTGRKYFAH